MNKRKGCKEIYKKWNIRVVDCYGVLFAITKSSRTKVGPLERDKLYQLYK